LVHTITGGGNIRSDEVTLVTSAAYDKMKELLKLGENFTNVFKDINVSFNLKDGRVYVKPFDTKVGDIRMNISGDQGIDQTMNYVIRTEIPRSALGGSVNSLIDNLSSQASAFGLSIKPADIMKINVKVGGVFGKPVVTPLLGSSSGDSESIVTQSGETIKEAVGATIDSGKDRLREEAEERGDELIREAEMRAQQLREEAATGAEKIRKEADLQAENLVREASDKGTLARIAADRAAEALRNEADKKAAQLIEQADIKADRLIDEARIRKQEMIEKI
jgi:vacuolar-type H+-ATPase subunit H